MAILRVQWPLIIKWTLLVICIDFKSNTKKESHAQWNVGWHYLWESIRYFTPRYYGCNTLSALSLTLNHVIKRGPWWYNWLYLVGVRNIFFVTIRKKAINMLMSFTSVTDTMLGMITIHLFFKSRKESRVLVNLLCFYLARCRSNFVSHLSYHIYISLVWR